MWQEQQARLQAERCVKDASGDLFEISVTIATVIARAAGKAMGQALSLRLAGRMNRSAAIANVTGPAIAANSTAAGNSIMPE